MMDMSEFEAELEAESREGPVLREYYTQLLRRFYLPFSIDTGDMCAMHKDIRLLVEFPRTDGQYKELGINLMAPFGCDSNCEEEGLDGIKCLDEMVQDFTTLKKQNQLLASKGYVGRFNRYDDGVEFVYQVPFKDEQDLVRVLKDFSFNDGF